MSGPATRRYHGTDRIINLLYFKQLVNLLAGVAGFSVRRSSALSGAGAYRNQRRPPYLIFAFLCNIMFHYKIRLLSASIRKFGDIFGCGKLFVLLTPFDEAHGLGQH
jgi:hypothetical protein